MYRGILTNKWLLGGIVCLIVFAVACVLWYQHDIADEKKAAAEPEKRLRQSEVAKKVSDTDSVTEGTMDIVPAESATPTARKPITEVTTEAESNTETAEQQQSETPTETATDAKVSVSPNGFGPYPEIPEEMRVPKDKVNIFWENMSKMPHHELLARVRVKLYQQGIRAEGVTYKRNGLIYPIIEGVRYVEWETRKNLFGRVKRYVARSTGHPDDGFDDITKGSLSEDDIPSHFKIYTYPDGGIDPYEFLNLSKE